MDEYRAAILYSHFLSGFASICTALLLFRRGTRRADLDALRQEMRATRTELSAAMNSALKNYGAMQSETLRQISDLQDKRLQGLDERFKSLSLQTELKLDHVRRTMETRLSSLQEDNGKRLEEMRATVDEKLQKTLDDRLTQELWACPMSVWSRCIKALARCRRSPSGSGI